MASDCKTSCQNDRGFTLIELLVVLAIVGLVSGLVVFSVSGSLTNVQLNTASKRVAAALRYARSQAASQNETYLATFEFAESRLSVLSWSDRIKQSDNGSVKAPGETTSEARVYNLPEGVMLGKNTPGGDESEASLLSVLFFPNGSSSGGAVTLTNSRGRSYAVEVDFITGIVTLREMSGTS
jgi:general secretion pathway protein H